MCLWVTTSSMMNPVPLKSGHKVLQVLQARTVGHRLLRGLFTPYTQILVPFGDGHYQAKNYKPATQPVARGSSINGGYIHSYRPRASCLFCNLAVSKTIKNLGIKPHGYKIKFAITAIDVCATGRGQDMVSRAIYIPAMDLRNYTDEEIRALRRYLPGSFTRHTTRVLKALGRSVPQI